MPEFHSAPQTSERVADEYRSIFALIEAVIWEALPDQAVQCVLFGRSSAGCHEYETRFYDREGEAYVDWLQEVVFEQIMTLVAELRSLVPMVEDETGDQCRFHAILSEQGSLRAEFLCILDMVEAGTEIFMCRIRRRSACEAPEAVPVLS